MLEQRCRPRKWSRAPSCDLVATIETSRRQTEDAIIALTDRFSAIVQRIDAALSAHGTGSQSTETGSDAQHSRNDLALSSMRSRRFS